MPSVEMTQHLYRFFPQLKDKIITVSPGSVAEVLNEVNAMAPGFADYILNEQGALRPHVKLSIDNCIVIDKKTLSDNVPENGTLFIFQALSGG